MRQVVPPRVAGEVDRVERVPAQVAPQAGAAEEQLARMLARLEHLAVDGLDPDRAVVEDAALPVARKRRRRARPARRPRASSRASRKRLPGTRVRTSRPPERTRPRIVRVAAQRSRPAVRLEHLVEQGQPWLTGRRSATSSSAVPPRCEARARCRRRARARARRARSGASAPSITVTISAPSASAATVSIRVDAGAAPGDELAAREADRVAAAKAPVGDRRGPRARPRRRGSPPARRARRSAFASAALVGVELDQRRKPACWESEAHDDDLCRLGRQPRRLLGGHHARWSSSAARRPRRRGRPRSPSSRSLVDGLSVGPPSTTAAPRPPRTAPHAVAAGDRDHRRPVARPRAGRR